MASYLLILVIFSIVGYFSWAFLYNNFYLVITQSTEMMNMQKNVPIETIDLNKFEKVIKKIDDKSTVKEDYIQNIRNPFDWNILKTKNRALWTVPHLVDTK